MSATSNGPADGIGQRAASRFDPAEIEALKKRENWPNIINLANIYAVIAVTVTVAIWSLYTLPVWAFVPITALAIVILGATQHQFGGAVHEGTHYVLFADKRASELASDWLAAFPLFTSTYSFRLHHLAHHQFVNDPKRDPNFGQAKESGHWLDFPLTHVELLIGIAKQLNPVRLVSYIVARARYSALGVDSNPYADPKRPGSPWAIRNGLLFAAGMPAVMIPLIAGKLWLLAFAALVAGTGVTVWYYWTLPEEGYPRSRINPVISHRVTAVSRILHMALLFGALTFVEWRYAVPAWGFFGLLWIVPLFTTFPLFMVMREWLQHGNADRGRYTNSRVFSVNPFVRYAVLPWGMDIHLPHHLFASVPHYKLKRLHFLLMRDPEYAAHCRIVEGWSEKGLSGLPTIVDILGPAYAPPQQEVHIDDSSLELADVNDAEGIAQQVEASRGDPTGSGSAASAG